MDAVKSVALEVVAGLLVLGTLVGAVVDVAINEGGAACVGAARRRNRAADGAAVICTWPTTLPPSCRLYLRRAMIKLKSIAC